MLFSGIVPIFTFYSTRLTTSVKLTFDLMSGIEAKFKEFDPCPIDGPLNKWKLWAFMMKNKHYFLFTI